ncbi:MAG: hypothetical protein J0I30_00735 [Burkholderiales bacterium]|nr:hypothetical protein [Burkholderiales bacterium]
MAANTMIKGGRAGQKAHLVPAPTFDRFTQEWTPPRHLRQAEIDAQPRQLSMGGIGNNTGLGGREARN